MWFGWTQPDWLLKINSLEHHPFFTDIFPGSPTGSLSAGMVTGPSPRGVQMISLSTVHRALHSTKLSAGLSMCLPGLDIKCVLVVARGDREPAGTRLCQLIAEAHGNLPETGIVPNPPDDHSIAFTALEMCVCVCTSRKQDSMKKLKRHEDIYLPRVCVV